MRVLAIMMCVALLSAVCLLAVAGCKKDGAGSGGSLTSAAEASGPGPAGGSAGGDAAAGASATAGKQGAMKGPGGSGASGAKTN